MDAKQETQAQSTSTMIFFGSQRENSFRCTGPVDGGGCGCNVFHKPDPKQPDLYECNSCGTWWRGE